MPDVLLFGHPNFRVWLPSQPPRQSILPCLSLYATCDVLPMMELVEEIKARGFNVLCTEPYVYCKSFEDNSGALELARLPKLRPRSKHINTCYHHFREHVRKGLVKIFPIDTKLQTADVLTKNLPQNDFVRRRISICTKTISTTNIVIGDLDGLEVSVLWLGDTVRSDVVGLGVTGLRLGDLDGLDNSGLWLGDTVGSEVVGLDG